MARNEKHPEQVKLEEIIKAQIRSHERSLQVEVGPSELGTPCDRRLALTLMHAPEVNVNEETDWRPTVGTAVHTWLDGAIEAHNDRVGHRALWGEAKVPVGTLAPGQVIAGKTDLYDPEWPGIVDWKITGPTSIKKVKQNGVGPSYRAQVHTYGRGVNRALGHPVEWVACFFLPSNGTLRDAYFWYEAYDPEFADSVIHRARDIQGEVNEPEGLPDYIKNLPTYYDNCGYCPFWNPTATARQWKQCKGDPEMATDDKSMDGLI